MANQHILKLKLIFINDEGWEDDKQYCTIRKLQSGII